MAFLLGMTGLASEAVAQEPLKDYPVCDHQPTESDVSAAKGAYKAGQVSFQEADYERALLYWEDAFRRDCTADKLLLNIARAYELSGNRRAAAHALSTFVERQPDAEEHSSVEKRIAKLEEKIREEEAAAALKDQEAESAPDQRTQQPEEDEVAPSRTALRPFWPVLLTAGGVAVAGAGGVLIYLGASGVSDEKDQIAAEFGCERKGLNWSCPSDDVRDQVSDELDKNGTLKSARAVRTLGIVAVGAGVAATTVGAVFWGTLWKSPSQERKSGLTSVTPVFTPRFQGVMVGGTF